MFPSSHSRAENEHKCCPPSRFSIAFLESSSSRSGAPKDEASRGDEPDLAIHLNALSGFLVGECLERSHAIRLLADLNCGLLQQ